MDAASDATTRLLTVLHEQADGVATDELLPLLYLELRQTASAMLRRERAGHTLQATALVHEAWLRLSKAGTPGWQGRRHFFAAASEAMRRILIERARRKATAKRGGGRQREEFEQLELLLPGVPRDLVEFDDVLQQLEAIHPRMRQIVNLRFFAGLSIRESAELMGCSSSSIERDWRFARSWLEETLGR